MKTKSPGDNGKARPKGLLARNGKNNKKDTSDNISPPARIVNLVNAYAELFHTPDPEAFAVRRVKDHFETVRIKDADFKRWIGKLYFEAEGKIASGENICAALNTLAGHALFDGEERIVYTRIAERGNRIYLDLANDLWEVVEITSSGWCVLPHSPVHFRRPPGMLALPKPVKGGGLDKLRSFLNVQCEEDFLLVLGWLLSAFRPTGPFPILALEGNHGSAKSTASRVLRSLIDPNTAPLRSMPTKERDLVIAAANSWCQVFENVSEVPGWLSDWLCRLSTGGGFSARLNYSDDEERLFNVVRPVLLNGIHVGLERPDALSRSLVITLAEISDEKRCSETQFWTQFNAARPRILGALLDAVSCALRRLPRIKLTKLPRMADFACWVAAAEPALGCAEGAFLIAYEGNRHDANELALESSPLVPALLGLLREDDWSGTASELLNELPNQLGIDTRQQGWPKTPAALSGQVRRLQPSLPGCGILVRMEKTAGANSRKIITISRKRDESLATDIENRDALPASVASLFDKKR